MNDTRTRLIKIMGKGAKATEAAEALGITDSAVSQYLADPEVAREITALRSELTVKQLKHDEEIDELETSVLAQLSRSAQLTTDPMKLTRIFQALNGAKRRGVKEQQPAGSVGQMVTLLMPTRVVNNFKVNGLNQVVTVGDRDINTIQSDLLLKQVKGAQHVQQSREVSAEPTAIPEVSARQSTAGPRVIATLAPATIESHGGQHKESSVA